MTSLIFVRNGAPGKLVRELTFCNCIRATCHLQARERLGNQYCLRAGASVTAVAAIQLGSTFKYSLNILNYFR